MAGGRKAPGLCRATRCAAKMGGIVASTMTETFICVEMENRLSSKKNMMALVSRGRKAKCGQTPERRMLRNPEMMPPISNMPATSPKVSEKLR